MIFFKIESSMLLGAADVSSSTLPNVSSKIDVSLFAALLSPGVGSLPNSGGKIKGSFFLTKN